MDSAHIEIVNLKFNAASDFADEHNHGFGCLVGNQNGCFIAAVSCPAIFLLLTLLTQTLSRACGII